jgi:biotin carboxyl carrier protein
VTSNQKQLSKKTKKNTSKSKKVIEADTNNLGKLLDKFKVKVSDQAFNIELYDRDESPENQDHYDVVVNGTLYSVEVESLEGEVDRLGQTQTGWKDESGKTASLAKPVGKDLGPSGTTPPKSTSAPSQAKPQSLTSTTQPIQPSSTMPAEDSKTLTAPMPGKILQINVQIGDSVEAGQSLIILEAMKMENVMTAPASGTVKDIPVQAGINVNQGEVLVVIV